MQTTIKHAPGQAVAYIAIGERAVEIRAFPWKILFHRKRTELSRKKPAPPGPTLPGFTEPVHPPQTNTVVGP